MVNCASGSAAWEQREEETPGNLLNVKRSQREDCFSSTATFTLCLPPIFQLTLCSVLKRETIPLKTVSHSPCFHAEPEQLGSATVTGWRVCWFRTGGFFIELSVHGVISFVRQRISNINTTAECKICTGFLQTLSCT